MSSTVPRPPGYPIVGNLFDVDPTNSIKSLDDLADKHGKIYSLQFFGNKSYFISSVDLVEEVCDEARFEKKIEETLVEVRNGVHDGLFTAHNDEPNWGIAHRLLMPAFGPISIKDMFDGMHDIASQLVSKWARLGHDTPIQITDDTTRLVFDTVALCAAGMRINSFYREDMHPFIDAMADFLAESGLRSDKTAVERLLNPGLEKKYRRDIELLRSTAQECIDNRRANPTDKKHLLTAMLDGKDPKTGQQLTEECVVDNMITFLIAGHETTSGLLSFTINNLLKNPEALQKAQQEVDTVVGSGPIQFQHMSKLPCIEAVLRETLRLTPTVSSIAVTPKRGTKEPVVLKGKYVIPADAMIYCQLTKSQKDPSVFGEDAMEYKPERMLDDKFRRLRHGAWEPFGNGSRACIGRPFAWQEAILVMTLILQNFNFRFADPGYQLRIHETLTQKPLGLRTKASLRAGIDPARLPQKLHSGAAANVEVGQAPSTPSTTNGDGNLLRSYLDRLPEHAKVSLIPLALLLEDGDLNQISGRWMKQWTTSPSNIPSPPSQVFGCGHRDWVSTYQKVPTTIEQLLVKKGATLFAPRGETDVSKGAIFDDFDAWMDILAERLSAGNEEASSPLSASFNVQISTNARSGHLRYNHMHHAKVISNERVAGTDATEKGAPEKTYLVLQLPTDMRYEAGDYLAVLPVNHTHTSSRVLRRFSLPWDAVMTITDGTHATMPANTELSVAAVLASYVELSMPATRRNKEIVAKCTENKLSDDSMSGSVTDIAERNPEIKFPFPTFLAMLPTLRLRQYSISSSSLADPSTASITFSVLENGQHLGAATTYLKDLEPGSTIQIAIKRCSNVFRLPIDDTIPLIMACAGSGVAPFRGCVQERAAKKASGKEVGEAVLFVGCRGESDEVFAEQFAEWEAQGVVKVFPAYSRQSELTKDCKYVQDRLWSERELVSRLFDQQGARAYVCGSSKIGQGISEVVAKIVCEQGEKDGEPTTYEEALKWWQTLRWDRYAVDVFD